MPNNKKDNNNILCMWIEKINASHFIGKQAKNKKWEIIERKDRKYSTWLHGISQRNIIYFQWWWCKGILNHMELPPLTHKMLFTTLYPHPWIHWSGQILTSKLGECTYLLYILYLWCYCWIRAQCTMYVCTRHRHHHRQEKRILFTTHENNDTYSFSFINTIDIEIQLKNVRMQKKGDDLFPAVHFYTHRKIIANWSFRFCIRCGFYTFRNESSAVGF